MVQRLMFVVLRSRIISNIAADFVAISETHLKGDEKIDIPGYFCITNNRVLRNLRAKRNSGGVCLLVKETVKSTLPSQQSDVTGMSRRYHNRCQNMRSL